jgi:Flp pilus assembly protein TadD
MNRTHRTFNKSASPRCSETGPARRMAVAVAAILALAVAAGCHHESEDEYLSAGDAAMQKTQLAEAEQNYKQAASLAPNDIRVHVALGNLYGFERKPAQARAEFMRVIELAPANAPAHSALGGIYESQGMNGEAEEQYRAAVALKPADPSYRLQLGTLLTRVNKAGWAESELRTAIGLQPRSAQAHLALANLLSTIPSEKAAADAEYAEVRALDPHLLPTAPATAVEPAGPGGAPPAEAAVTPPASASVANEHKLKPVNRKFRLTRDSPVYQVASNTGTVVAHVHHGRFVHVTGIQGDWLQVTLRNGTVGFIPVSAAE